MNKETQPPSTPPRQSAKVNPIVTIDASSQVSPTKEASPYSQLLEGSPKRVILKVREAHSTLDATLTAVQALTETMGLVALDIRVATTKHQNNTDNNHDRQLTEQQLLQQHALEPLLQIQGLEDASFSNARLLFSVSPQSSMLVSPSSSSTPSSSSSSLSSSLSSPSSPLIVATTTLRRLRLTRSLLSPTAGWKKLIGDLLFENRNLHQLVLKRNDLSGIQGQELLNLLHTSSHLTHLNLTDNNLDAALAGILHEYMERHAPTLVLINFSHNPQLGPLAVNALLQGLISSRNRYKRRRVKGAAPCPLSQLQTLNLSCTGMTDANVPLLLELLKREEQQDEESEQQQQQSSGTATTSKVFRNIILDGNEFSVRSMASILIAIAQPTSAVNRLSMMMSHPDPAAHVYPATTSDEDWIHYDQAMSMALSRPGMKGLCVSYANPVTLSQHIVAPSSEHGGLLSLRLHHTRPHEQTLDHLSTFIKANQGLKGLFVTGNIAKNHNSDVFSGGNSSDLRPDLDKVMESVCQSSLQAFELNYLSSFVATECATLEGGTSSSGGGGTDMDWSRYPSTMDQMWPIVNSANMHVGLFAEIPMQLTNESQSTIDTDFENLSDPEQPDPEDEDGEDDGDDEDDEDDDDDDEENDEDEDNNDNRDENGKRRKRKTRGNNKRTHSDLIESQHRQEYRHRQSTRDGGKPRHKLYGPTSIEGLYGFDHMRSGHVMDLRSASIVHDSTFSPWISVHSSPVQPYLAHEKYEIIPQNPQAIIQSSPIPLPQPEPVKAEDSSPPQKDPTTEPAPLSSSPTAVLASSLGAKDFEKRPAMPPTAQSLSGKKHHILADPYLGAQLVIPPVQVQQVHDSPTRIVGLKTDRFDKTIGSTSTPPTATVSTSIKKPSTLASPSSSGGIGGGGGEYRTLTQQFRCGTEIRGLEVFRPQTGAPFVVVEDILHEFKLQDAYFELDGVRLSYETDEKSQKYKKDRLGHREGKLIEVIKKVGGEPRSISAAKSASSTPKTFMYDPNAF